MLREGSDTRCWGEVILLMSAVLLVLASVGLASAQAENSTGDVLFFYSTTCPHCIAEKAFLEKLEEKYPWLEVDYLVAEDNWGFYEETCGRYNATPVGVPKTFIGEKAFASYTEAECNLQWYKSYGAYMGCPNQIEDAVLALENASAAAIPDDAEILFFHSTTCPHCIKEKAFLEKLEVKYPQLKVNYIIADDNRAFYEETAKKHNTTASGVPRTFIGEMVFIGYSEGECKLRWYQTYGGYIGCPNQIENAARRLMNLSTIISEGEAMEIARKSGFVCDLTAACNDTVANAFLIDGVYYVAWWTPERINSNIDYPNVLVLVDAKRGEVLESKVPDGWVPGVFKPAAPGFNYLFYALAAVIILLPAAFMIFGSRIPTRYWISAIAFALIALFFMFSKSLPSMDVVDYATHQSFPVFTFIIAIVDGFNPCAFAVLAFLLSILTHTKSRKKMLTIGTVFIVTSGFMYFLFIIVLLFLRVELLAQYREIIRFTVAFIALAAGAINLKDFFYFKQGISLTLSPEKQGTIFKRAGKLVRDLEKAGSKREMLLVVAGTMALAAMVNLVELGCTFILPMAYLETLISSYPNDAFSHILYTAFYAAVYVIPLFAILGSFIYAFKSERMTEKQARVLKLLGGGLMVILGLILLFKPELLVFG